MREEGIVNMRTGKKGQQVVEVFVEIPIHLNPEQAGLLKAFDESLKDKNYKHKKGFLDRLKDLFS